MNVAPAVKRVVAVPRRLAIEWHDGRVAEFASVWLRDNRREDRDPHSGQRLIDVCDLPAEPRIRAAELVDGALRIVWDDEPAAAMFDLAWLAAQAAAIAVPRAEFSAQPWLNGATLEASSAFAWIDLDEARGQPPRRLHWLTRLLREGIAFIRGVPADAAAILDAMTLIGRVAATNYGEVFDVRTVAEPDNLAYSDRGLGLHTDNPYREPVPGFQALHVLVAAPAGGESLFADGFALAAHLRDIDAAAFRCLTATPVPFRYRSKDVELYAERPLIQLSCSGAIAAVHYNSRSIAPLLTTADAAEAFYAAYRSLAALLRDPCFQLRYRMRDGDLAVFDNQRILHGRTGFAAARHPRHLRGCYLTRDSVYAEAALLRRRHEPVGER